MSATGSSSRLSTERRLELEETDELLAVSAAARMLGVSSSSLRAWAAAGRVPHVRTAGGHRRFARRELERWLRDRGGEPPSTPTRSGELVPTRSEPQPELATAIADRSTEILDALEDEVARVAGRRGRGGAQRRARARDAIESLVEGLACGDLGPPYREAEWEGFRHGASGGPGDVPVTEALALRRAVERCMRPWLSERPGACRSLERALDRMATKVAAGYADGVRSRVQARGG
jgi:excisionase family DNA binding protein